MPCHKKKRRTTRKRSTRYDGLNGTNRLIGQTTRAVIGLGALGVVTHAVTEMNK